MKILLVNPPMPADWYNNEFYLPLSLLYLAAVLRDNGDKVDVLDMKTLSRPGHQSHQGDYESVLLQTIARTNPDLIGFGCLFSGNFQDALRYSEVCKSNHPGIPIVAGGIHFTIYAEKILQHCPSIDWIILGEGEQTLVRLVNRLKSGARNFEQIDGIAYRDAGRVVVSPKTGYITDIDQIPFPAYDLLDLEAYHVDTSHWHNPKALPIRTSIPLISSRSCPHHCSFCSMYRVMGPKWRARSAKNFVDEIDYLYHTYEYRHFSFMDDNLTLSKRRTLEICRTIIERKLDIQFETPNGLSLRSLDEEVLEQLVAAGMVRTYLAIESGSDYIRNQVMKKKVSLEQIRKVVQWTKKYPELFVNAFFIIGMPEETAETLEETFNLIREIDVDKIHIHNIVPFPSTGVYQQAVRDNLLVDLDPDDFYKSGKLYFKNRDCFFIKPYNLSLTALHEFRERVELFLKSRRSSTAAQRVTQMCAV